MRHRRITVLGWVAVLVVCVAGAGAAGATFKSNFSLPSSDSERALNLLKHRFPGQRRLHRVLSRVGVEPSAEAAVAPLAEPRPERPRERELA
jgi:hypothetical protein